MALKYSKASEKLDYKSERSISNAVIRSKICLQTQKIDSASYYAEKALKICEQTESNIHFGNVYGNQADLCFAKKQYAKAIFYAEKAKLNAVETFNLSNHQKSLDLLYKIYKTQHNDRKALECFEKSTVLKDSINRNENRNVTLKADFKYQTEKKDNQLKALAQQKKITELENKRKTTSLYVVVLFFGGLVIIGYVLFRRFKEKKQSEIFQNQLLENQKTLEAEKKATESELKALKSQMNPHFVFNALNSIQNQFMFGDKKIANKQMSNFTALTRDILEVSSKKTIPIETEVEILTKYLELEKMRFKDDFDYSITIAPNIDEDYHKIPPMLVQPFVENAIKHGLLHKEGNKTVQIHFEIDPTETFILCSIQDNGIGRQKSAEIKAKNANAHNSFSTNSVAQRLQILNNDELESALIYEDLTDENGTGIGTIARLKIGIV